MDLVIQSSDLPSSAVDSFRVACLARRAQRKLNSARLVDIQDDADTRKAVAALAAYWKCDTAFVPNGLRLADFRLLAIDMDSTLIAVESLDEVAALAGRGAEVAAITEAAMRGEIADCRESLRRRVSMLAGTEVGLLDQVWNQKLRLNEGAEELVRACQRAGLKILLATSGFTFFADRLRDRLGLDFTRANELGIRDGRLTGKVTGPGGAEIIDAAGKAQAVREACAQIGCATNRAIAVGDGANDLAMLKLAGVSVAYRAKPIVRAQTTYQLCSTPLSGVLEWFD
jgi:phosphoserine phosphatase